VAEISYPVASGTLPGYLALPPGGAASDALWPGVVVIHEIMGLTDDVRLQADRFAANGYIALAPDLFGWGATARCLVSTVRAMAAGHGRALNDINAARRFLAGRADCTGSVGVIGFCLGGGLAILVSPDGFDVAAPNYGQVPKDAERRLHEACPMVASYGGRDRQLKGHAGRLDAALTVLGIDHDVKEYDEAGHGFLFPHTGWAAKTEPWLVKYDAAAADDAWQRIFAFFDRHLGKDARE
jgi:carboxymethylenebutenolidase